MIDRTQKIKSLLPDKATAILITSDINRFYFTKFKSSAGAVLITNNSTTLFVDFRYYEAAQKSVKRNINVVCFKKLYDSINDVIKNEGIKSIIIEDKSVTLSEYNQFKNSINAEVCGDFDLSDKILDTRMIKDKYEIDCIKQAQLIAQKSYIELLNYIKVGVSENKLALELEYLMKKYGAQRSAFDIICVSGVNSSLPHGVPSDKLVENGDFITFDFGAVVDGYHSDMTRTVALNYVTDEMKSVYDIVLNAHIKARDTIKAGVKSSDVDKAARDYITNCGYGDCFGHSTGHGVGLDIHEKPTVYLTNNNSLKTDSVITVEPGIYIPSKYGVRIEDMYLVTDFGFIDLATIDKELIII